MLGKLDAWSFYVSLILKSNIKGKENNVVDALNRKVHEMHVASLSIFQSELRQQIVNHVARDELYEQVKDKLQQQSLENKYEGYKLEEDGLLTYKNSIYIPKIMDLRRIVMDEIRHTPYYGHPRY